MRGLLLLGLAIVGCSSPDVGITPVPSEEKTPERHYNYPVEQTPGSKCVPAGWYQFKDERGNTIEVYLPPCFPGGPTGPISDPPMDEHEDDYGDVPNIRPGPPGDPTPF